MKFFGGASLWTKEGGGTFKIKLTLAGLSNPTNHSCNLHDHNNYSHLLNTQIA